MRKQNVKLGLSYVPEMTSFFRSPLRKWMALDVSDTKLSNSEKLAANKNINLLLQYERKTANK